MKKILVILLPIVALVFVISAVARLNPPQERELPKAMQIERLREKRLEDTHALKVSAFARSVAKQEEFRAWLEREKNRKAMSPEASKAHGKELRTILTAEELTQYRALGDERRAAKKQLSAEKLKRNIEMAGGEAEYKRHQEDMKKAEQRRKEKAAEAKAAQEAAK
jgi:hypothetical protein